MAGPPHPVVSLLDSALYRANMNRSDLWLPSDLLPGDAFRLSRVDSMFDNPLVPGDYLPEAVAALKERGYNLNPPKADWLTAFLDIAPRMGANPGPSPPERFDSLQTLTSYLWELTDWGLASVDDYWQVVDESRQRLFQEKIDSVLFPSREGENMDLFALKEAEERERRMAKGFFAALDSIPYSELTRLGVEVYNRYRNLFHKLGNPSFKTDLPFPDTVTHLDKSGIRITLGTRGNDVYDDSSHIIIDPGGDDIYRFTRGGKSFARERRLSVIIDLAGDDTYLGSDFSFGGAFMGISILMDGAGDDLYRAGIGSLGSGIFGFGILEDMAGSDVYTSKVLGQGSGAFGAGLLLDHHGHDLYHIQGYGQGFGFTGGLGLLWDYWGNDQYQTSGPFQDFLRYDEHFISFSQGAALGYRPIASGGVGLLLDYQGNDGYTADIYAQGSAYWFGFGALWDGRGDDSYRAYQYAQGAGVHFAHGFLWDGAGDDSYVAHGVSQGCGHDVAVGMLWDEGGNDNYQAYGLSMGGGNANAISLFLDVEGRDVYLGKTPANMMGYSDLRREYGMIGVFADGEGVDWVADTLGREKTHLKSTLGVYAQFNSRRIEKNTNAKTTNAKNTNAKNTDAKNTDAKTTDAKKVPAKRLNLPLAAAPDSLFIQASAAPEKYQDNVQPARDSLQSRAGTPKVRDFLLSKLSTESPRERHALREILSAIAKSHPKLLNALVDSLQSPHPETRNLAAAVCRKAELGECAPFVLPRLKDTRWNNRYNAAWTLAVAPAGKHKDRLASLLKDPHPYVRMRAAYGMGAQWELERLPERVPELLDVPEQLVRNAFVEGFKKRKTAYDAKAVLYLMDRSQTAAGQKSLLQLIPGLEPTRKNKKLLKKHWRRFPVSHKNFLKDLLRADPANPWREVVETINN